MESKELKHIFSQLPQLANLKNFLASSNPKREMEILGISASEESVIFSTAAERGLYIIVKDNREQAEYITADLYNLLEEESIFFFPTAQSGTTAITTVKDSSRKVQRSAALSALNRYMQGEMDSLVLVTYPTAVMEGIPNRGRVAKSIFSIKRGDKISHNYVIETLLENKFSRVDFVSQPGEFAVRGSIIDLFSYSNNLPYRLDFFGNEVESIKLFDINTQLSTEQVECVEVFPNLFEGEEAEQQNRLNLFEYLAETDYIVWGEDYYTLKDFSLPKERKRIIKRNISKRGEATPDERIEFHSTPQPPFNKNFALLSEDIILRNSEGYKVVICSSNEKQIERLKSIFEREEEREERSQRPVFVSCNASFSGGFVDKDTRICLYTDHQIFDRYHRVKVKREVERSERLTLNELSAFQVGDYVVHIDHGVGIFGGLVKTNINGKIQEAIKLIYKDNDVIFVSIHGLHRIARYKSKDGAAPKIYKLGTPAWSRLKEQTKRKVKDIAEDLIKLYAKRMKTPGFAFSPDSYMQHELEASFMYEDTPDQLKTTQLVKEDMEKPHPMDRLVCGDVGFGKTEIAIRAAFKAVSDSKQVALLVPTTILALQHYKTFSGRLKEFPCKIEYISRLRSAKEIRDILQRLQSGEVDIIIGTHRLLNKEVKFKDLGLLIIDEEQKFGVAAKERLKQMKLSVDTLTLSATPIPRTLQFSLLGARDLSIINTPPPNRLPVQTEVLDFNEDAIRDAINFEVERGGQVFFVHNRVEDIMAVEEIIKRICPGIKTCVGHGQMDPKQLENIVLDFMAGDYDVLVATTIIENGIDIPNANTIIINQAQNFGLSDLHQMRGRVGRSNVRAFCYLIVPPMIALSDDARRRIHAIEAFSDLGSGFNIAMQDLDIRGAGNLLGGEQSGFIADMGFETYQRILSEAFEEIALDADLPAESTLPANISYVSDCNIDTDFELLIPDDYIEQTSEKIRLYKELDAITDEEHLQRFKAELADRFGPLPKQLEELTFIVRLRGLALKLAIEKIVLKRGIMLAYFVSDKNSPFYKSALFNSILVRLQGLAGKVTLKQLNDKLYIKAERVTSVERACSICDNLLN
ncbi:MAG: transcription-repair coupling factor [bacterium]|nr:transcription-repair coupling factor [bacterium]